MRLPVVILAVDPGASVHLEPLTNDNFPPALLPVANFPILHYQLRALETADFDEIIIVCAECYEDAIKTYVTEKYRKLYSTTSVSICTVNNKCGTVDALLQVERGYSALLAARGNFLVLNSDIVLDPVFSNLSDVHMIHDATMTALLAPRVVASTAAPTVVSGKAGSSAAAEALAPGGPHTVEGSFIDYISLDPSETRLLYIKSSAEIEDHTLVFPKSHLKKRSKALAASSSSSSSSSSSDSHRSHLRVTTRFSDPGIYVFSTSIFNIIRQHRALNAKKKKSERQHMDDIKYDLVPHLVNDVKIPLEPSPSRLASSMSSLSLQPNNSIASPSSSSSSSPSSSAPSSPSRAAAPVLPKSSSFILPSSSSSSDELSIVTSLLAPSIDEEGPITSAGLSDLQAAYFMSASEFRPSSIGDEYHCCQAVIAPEDVYCRRADTIASFFSINMEVVAKPNPDRPPNAVPEENSRVQITGESLVAEPFHGGNRNNLKHVIIGEHCRLVTKTRIANSIIFDHVSIEEECVISGSIICSNATIQKKTQLTGCVVGPKVTVEEDEDAKNEKFSE